VVVERLPVDHHLDRAGREELAGEAGPEQRGGGDPAHQRSGGDGAELVALVVALEPAGGDAVREDQSGARGARVGLGADQRADGVEAGRGFLEDALHDLLGAGVRAERVRDRVHGAARDERDARERVLTPGCDQGGERAADRAVAADQHHVLDAQRVQARERVLGLVRVARDGRTRPADGAACREEPIAPGAPRARSR
jgi:hypothetical protein